MDSSVEPKQRQLLYKDFIDMCKKGCVPDDGVNVPPHFLMESSFGGFRWACRNGHIHVMQWIWDQLPTQKRDEAVHALHEYALRFAAEQGHADVVLFLLNHGANPQVEDHSSLKRTLQGCLPSHRWVWRYLLCNYTPKELMDSRVPEKEECVVEWFRLRRWARLLESRWLFSKEWVLCENNDECRAK